MHRGIQFSTLHEIYNFILQTKMIFKVKIIKIILHCHILYYNITKFQSYSTNFRYFFVVVVSFKLFIELSNFNPTIYSIVYQSIDHKLRIAIINSVKRKESHLDL